MVIGDDGGREEEDGKQQTTAGTWICKGLAATYL